MSQEKQELADRFFNGDVQRYEYEHQQSLKDRVSWNDLVNQLQVLPQLSQQAEDLIIDRLGYLPHETITISYEPYLRALIQQHQNGQLSSEAFEREASAHIKLLRNTDLEIDSNVNYAEWIYEDYHANWLPYGQQVRSRLQSFLGYPPDLNCSLTAELWLRDIFAKDTIHLPEHLTAIDCKAITQIKYREILLQQGLQAANQSSLWYQDYLSEPDDHAYL